MDSVKLSSDQADSGRTSHQTKDRRLVPRNVPTKTMESIKVNLNTPVELQVNITLPESCHYTDEAQSRWKATTVEQGKFWYVLTLQGVGL